MKSTYVKTQILVKTKNFISSLNKLWRKISYLKLLLVTFCILILLSIVFTPHALAIDIPADTANGAKIFKANCAGCHVNGGNIIRRGKNLKLRALKRYKMDSLGAISAIVANGKNNMSSYKDRLTVTEIRDVAAYVLEQAQTGWKNS